MRTNKRIIATMAALLIAAAGVIIFEACNKKTEMVKNIPELNIVELSDMDKDMLLFGEQMKYARKGGEAMKLEEAVRNLTNYQNFRLCDASRYSSDMERFTIETEIPVNYGNVYLSDLYSIYESNKKQIRDILATLEGDDNNIYCIINRVDTDNKDDEYARIVTYVIIPREGVEPPAYYFDDSLCWVVNPQTCTECTGGLAVDVLSSMLVTIKVGNYGCPPGYRIYFYDNEEFFIRASDYPDVNSPNGYFGLIHGNYDSDCLRADEMSYYLYSAINKIDEWSNTPNALGKHLIYLWYAPVFESILVAEFANIGCTVIGLDE